MNQRIIRMEYVRRLALSAFVLSACQPELRKSSTEQVAPKSISIVRFSPQSKTRTQPLTVSFSRPVVPQASVGEGPVINGPGPFQITPALPGHHEWKSRSELVFVPSEPFSKSTRYSVSIDESVLGFALTGIAEFKFHTKMFALRSVEPFYRGPKEKIRANVNFTHRVRPSVARSTIRFFYPGDSKQEIHAVLQSKKPGKSMAFELDATRAMLSESGVEVHVDNMIGPLGGGTPLGKNVIRSMLVHSAAKLKITRTRARQQGQNFQVLLRFNAQVDPQIAKDHLSIEPKVAVTVSRQYQELRLVGAFKPGVSYSIRFREGLFSDGGHILTEAQSSTVFIPDFESSLSFEGEGNYLMKSGRKALNLKTVNVKRVRISVQKIYENNLVHVIPRLGLPGRSCEGGGCWEDEYDRRYSNHDSHYRNNDLSTMGPNLFSGELPIDSTKNKATITSIPFSEIETGKLSGVYRVRVSDKEESWTYVEKWMLATDLGLTLKSSAGEHRVQVVSLKTKRPVRGAKVKFLSRSNIGYGTRISDASGVATLVIDPKLHRDPMSLITVKLGRDFSYLTVATNEIPVADFQVGGVGSNSKTYQAYLYLDRGLYRPGDKVQLTAIVRTKTLTTPPTFPLQLEIRDPKWRLFKSIKVRNMADGAFALTLDIPSDALTGDYAVRVLSPGGESMGRTRFKVEDFMPDRIKVDVSAKTERSDLKTPTEYEVASAYLFGAPASKLRVESRCHFSETTIRSNQYKSFPMARDSDVDRAPRVNFSRNLGEAQLDESGKLIQSCTFQSSSKPRRPIRATLFATVSENGGRAVAGKGSSLLHAHDVYVGIRRNSKDNYVQQNTDAALQLLAVDREGNTKAGVKLKATFYRSEWKTILKLVNGRYRYVSETTYHQIKEQELSSLDQAMALPFVPPTYGRFRVDIEALEGGSKSSIRFWVSGHGSGAFEMSNPDQVSLSLDRKKYRRGEKAKLLVRSSFAGTLYLSIERDNVIWSSIHQLDGNMGSFEIPVSDAMLPNAYVVAQLLRSSESKEKRAPMRAFGVIPIFLESDKHRLGVTIKAPDKIRPNQTLDVLLKVEGALGKSRITLAAVDEGILRINGQASPDPLKFFMRKRRLGVQTFDLYDSVLPELEGQASSIVKASGGDGEVRKKHLNPMSVKRVKPVALWSGLVQTNKEGWARVKLKVPQFNGQLRLMAVAFKGSKFGADQRPIVVKDPIVITPTLPRFVAPLDAFDVPVEVFNGTSQTAKIIVSAHTKGKLLIFGDAAKTLTLAANSQGQVKFAFKADEVVGKVKVHITAESAHHETEWSADLPLRAPRTATSEGHTFAVRTNEPARWRFPKGYYPESYQAKITVSALPIGQFGASLEYLLKYPHGCLEQTTSRSFPLLYLSDLAGASGASWITKDQVDDFVNSGISRVKSMLLRHGGFSYWPGGRWGYSWTSVYATHFLVEADRAGFEVGNSELNLALAHLKQMVRNRRLSIYRNRASSSRDRAYALFVLALAKQPQRSEMHLLAKDIKSQKTPDSETFALLNGAMLLSGDRARTRSFINQEVSMGSTSVRKGFGSSIRATAMTLSVLAQLAPTHRSVPMLTKKLIDSAKTGRWGTTQENAYALMALGKISRQFKHDDFNGTIKIDGETIKTFGHKKPIIVTSKGPEWISKSLEIKVTGSGTAFVGVEISGISASPLAAKQEGLMVQRFYFKSSGEPLLENEIQQGEVVITKIELRNTSGDRIENLAIVDLLPAGLEIENPRLSDQAIKPWMKKDRSEAQYMDVRDDRLILFASLNANEKNSFYYAARAVTKGEYVLPHVHAEAMYDPMTVAYNGAGQFKVIARE
jgi:uncharacterized protein YfaS (alpha-2-macroglobulin family)